MIGWLVEWQLLVAANGLAIELLWNLTVDNDYVFLYRVMDWLLVLIVFGNFQQLF